MKLEFGTGSRFGRLNFIHAKNIIDYALKLGINRFDTGYTYGKFKSQPLLGRCLKKRNYISLKVYLYQLSALLYLKIISNIALINQLKA